MTCANQFSDAGRCHAYPEFLCFDFFWDAKLQSVVFDIEFGSILPSSAGAKKVKTAFFESKKSAFSINFCLKKIK